MLTLVSSRDGSARAVSFAELFGSKRKAIICSRAQSLTLLTVLSPHTAVIIGRSLTISVCSGISLSVCVYFGKTLLPGSGIGSALSLE